MRIYMLAAVAALKFPTAEDDSVAGVFGHCQQKPLRSKQKKVNQLDLLPCPICGQKVLEEDQSQHEFWDIKCLRTHAWNSCGNWKKAKEIARRIRELREYKFDLKRAEDAFLAASRPGASCKAKPCKAQAKKELRKSKMKRER